MVNGMANARALWLTAMLAAAPAAMADDGFDAAYGSIGRDDLAGYIKTLASDEFQGRGPGSAGERITVDYLAQMFRAAGATPGMNGSYFQDVPLVEMRRERDPTFELVAGAATERLTHNQDFASFAGGAREQVSIAGAPVVFVGFGITAPEQRWDDYAGLDVRGKMVVILRGEPTVPGDDPAFFKGRELTRHGIQPTKYENAAAHGARGVIMIHTEQSAGYPWSVLASGGGNAQMFLDGSQEPKLDIVVHVTEATANKLFRAVGGTLETMTRKANTRGFSGVALPQQANATYSARARRIVSKNVVAMIRGVEAPDECVVYTAHWDHLGRNETLKGDQIFNGAVDNATGTAALLELAQAYSKLPRAPRRSVVFVATTAEEKGLLGGEYHARRPACALAKTAAVMNLDALFPFGPFDAMTVPGLGSSEVEAVFAKAAARIGRVLQPDSAPEVGAYYRSDHYPFAKRGVPAIFAVGNPRDTGALDPKNPVSARFIDYITTKYHKVDDEYDAATWDLAGVEGDVRVYFEAGLEIANGPFFPNWLPGNEFRGIRDDMRRGR